MNELPARQIRKFNPGTFQSDDEVIEQFVVRIRELEIALEVLRGNIESPSCQHVLVVAPRGRGKTMLLARAAAEIRTNDELAGRLLPVRFMEESQEIFNIADFWLEALFHLARESAAHDPELARELRETHADLSARWGDQSLEDRARAAVLAAADRLDRKLVLMVENLHSLCESVDEDFGWKLRGVLQSEPQIVLLASATSRFESLDDAEQPFFELFRIIGLEPLTTEECRRLWQVVSGDAVSGREIRPLQILTGGSPRLLVIVAGFARHHSLRQLMEELVTLIDEHTEYFRSHLEVLAKTERRVYLAVIDLWRPSSTAEIAARARMDVRTVSTMLGRLVERGAIIAEGSGRKRLYAAAERLYSIYYKLRRERDEAAVVENLIRFMVVFYNEEERAEMFPKLIQEAAESAVIREGLDRAAARIPEFESLYSGMMRPDFEFSGYVASGEGTSSTKLGAANRKWIKRHYQKITKLFNERAFEKVIKAVDYAFASDSANWSQVPDSSVALLLLMKADSHQELDDFEAAISTYEETVERFGNSNRRELQWPIAVALLNKGNARKELGDCEGAIATYNEVVERFGNINSPDIQERVAVALVFKGIAREILGDFGAAIAAYKEVVERFSDNSAPELQRWIARALAVMGIAQIQIGHADEALHTCEALERRLGIFLTGEEEIEFRWQTMYVWVRALLLKGNLQAAMDAFHSAYSALVPGEEGMIHEMLWLVSDLVAAGVPTHDMLEILTSDEAKSSALAPLIVALRQRAGETVRAPAEVIEVAADILKRIEEKAAQGVSGIS